MVLKFADGRVAELMPTGRNKLIWWADNYIMKNGVVIGKKCKKHGLIGCENIAIFNCKSRLKAGVNSSYRVYCKLCIKDIRDDFYSRRIKVKGKYILPDEQHPEHISRRIENRITRLEDGREALVCNHCRRKLGLEEYYRQRGQYIAICHDCRWEMHGLSSYRRRIRKAFGTDSPEYAFAQNEKRRRYLEAMCWVLGIFTDRRVLTKEGALPIQRVLQRMPPNEEEFRKTLEEKIPSLPAHGRRLDRMAMRPLYELQMSTGLQPSKRQAAGD